jgi:hypothetical protein
VTIELVVEDGSGLPNANTLGTVAGLRAYAAERGASLPPTSAGGDEACKVLLIKAMDRMEAERANYQGERVSQTQALSLPRVGMCVDGWEVPSNEIPRTAVYCQYAFAIEAQTTDLMPTQPANQSGPVTNKTVGPLSISYANPGSVRRTPAVAKAEALLRTLLKRNGLFAIRA